MPLDPLVKAFLDSMTALAVPKTWTMQPAQAREMFRGTMQLVGPKDVPVGRTQNIVIPAPHGMIAARVYTPIAAGGEPLPALVYYHGGGFVLGGIDTHDGLCRMLAHEGGFRVVSVEYRLAPEFPFPAAIEDAYTALCWIENNAADIGVDPNAIAVGGESAGGLLAAAVTQMARDKGGPDIAFQMLLFPVTQIGGQTKSMQDYSVGYFMERQTLDWFYEKYLPSGADKASAQVSPLRAADFSRLPPAYVMLAGADPLRDEGLQYVEKLRGAGVTVTLRDYPDMVHCFIYLQSVLPQAREAVADAARVVAEALDQA